MGIDHYYSHLENCIKFFMKQLKVILPKNVHRLITFGERLLENLRVNK